MKAKNPVGGKNFAIYLKILAIILAIIVLLLCIFVLLNIFGYPGSSGPSLSSCLGTPGFDCYNVTITNGTFTLYLSQSTGATLNTSVYLIPTSNSSYKVYSDQTPKGTTIAINSSTKPTRLTFYIPKTDQEYFIPDEWFSGKIMFAYYMQGHFINATAITLSLKCNTPLFGSGYYCKNGV